MARFLIVTWDGAGNLVPTLGIVRTLVGRGHDVRVIGHRSIVERCGDQGARFVGYDLPPDWDAMDDPDDFEQEVKLLMDGLCFSGEIARDVAAELEREPADAVLVDCMLFSAINVALASGAPTGALFHTPYTLFRAGPVVEMFTAGLDRMNRQRTELGLPPASFLAEVHDECGVALVALPKEFEPDVSDAPNVVRCGPVLDAPALCSTVDEVDVADGPLPLVLVSLSTSEQGQAPLLERIADAVATLPVRAIVTTGPSLDPSSVAAGANTKVVRYVPHAEVLPAASLVVTHAGLGTTMAALGRGVPLLCVPMGRDQFFNAERVEALGAGRMLPPDSASDAIAEAARTILGDSAMRASAKQAAVVISGYRGAEAAARELEALSR